MRHAKSPAQQKERTPQAARLLRPRVAWSSSGIRYTAPAGLIPSWAELALGLVLTQAQALGQVNHGSTGTLVQFRVPKLI
jgi:hypothetical protein